MIKLFQFPVSGNSHKVRLMLALLGLEYETVNAGGTGIHHKSPEFLAMNPFGQVPVLVDGALVLRDSQGILAYLAQRYGRGSWWPESAHEVGEVVAWFSTAANEVAKGPNLLRLHYRFGRPIDVSATEALCQQVLQVLEARLGLHDWLVGSRATAADVAVYPYIALAPEAKLDLTPYPGVRAWLTRIQALPRYLDMPGIWHFTEGLAV